MGMGPPRPPEQSLLLENLLGGEIEPPDPEVTCPICQGGQEAGELWAFWPGGCSRRFHHQR
eukprot:905457-Alexandrium_andersonii.AAC.1